MKELKDGRIIDGIVLPERRKEMSKEKMAFLELEDDNNAIVIGERDSSVGTLRYTRSDARSFFEQGASWQREHSFTPHHMNAVEASKEALARWPD